MVPVISVQDEVNTTEIRRNRSIRKGNKSVNSPEMKKFPIGI